MRISDWSSDVCSSDLTMKIINNLLSATAMAASAEAFVMGAKAGLDPDIMVDVISAGSGRNTAVTDKFPTAILTRSFDYGFRTELLYKDVKLAVDEAEALGVPMWGSEERPGGTGGGSK